MITQVLNKTFVLNQLESVMAELNRPRDERRGVDDLPEFEGTLEDLQAAEESLDIAKDAQGDGQRNYNDDPDARRGEEGAPIDDTVYLSHDPILSNLQSALDEYIEEKAFEKIDVQQSDDRRGGDDFIPVSDRSLADCDVLPRTDDGRRLFNQYSELDPRWVASLFAMGVSKFRKPHPFNPRAADEVRIGNKARLILVGDWGSGIPRAVAVAARMREEIEKGNAAGLEQHVIHLGDVYYSGWKKEYERNFLAHWPVHPGEEGDRLVSWCLNGNHDMYSGGYGYFEYLLADPRFARQNRSSFFSLRNDYWDILGLDTAYEDGGLQPPQMEWIQKRLEGASRKSMLLSHHQLLGVYDEPPAKLHERFAPFLGQRPIDVWFWGHEHRCVFYRSKENVRNARLIGHGGVPVYMNHRQDDAYLAPAYYEYREYSRHLLEKWALMGFAVVDFDGAVANVRYIDEFGTEHQREAIQ
jgi:hypothetical protein